MTGSQRASRALLAAPFVAAAAAALIYALIWRHGALSMQRSIEDWADDMRGLGVSVDYADLKTMGFPFLLRGRITSIAISDSRGNYWRSASLDVHSLPFSRKRLIFSPASEQAFGLAGFGDWTISAQGALASIESRGEKEWFINVESGPGAVAAADGRAEVSSSAFLLSMAPAPNIEGGIEASLVVKDLETRVGRGRTAISALEAFASLKGLPESRELDIGRFRIAADGSAVEFKGVLDFDAPTLAPAGLEGEIVNPAALVSHAERLGAVTPDQAEKARAALTLAALAGGGKIAGLLEFSENTVSFAGVRLAELPASAAAAAPPADQP